MEEPLAEPFVQPEDDRVERRRWWHLFRDEPRQRRIDRFEQDARQAIEWLSMPYHQKFIDWLDEEIDRPVDTTDQGQILVGMARCNALKEVKQKLRNLKKRARVALGED